MLTRLNRLVLDRDFTFVFKKGRSVSGLGVILRFVRLNVATPTKFAFVISAKTAKRAVVRNLVKRRMREIVRKLLPRILPGYYCVFTAKKDSIIIDFKVLSTDIENVLLKSGILKK